MKYVVSFFLLISSMNLFAQERPHLIISDSVIQVCFTSNLTQAELDEIKSQLKARDVFLNYAAVNFSKKGKLSHIDFSVSCSDGSSGSASIKHLTKKSQFGFRIDLLSGEVIGFQTGHLKDLDNL